MAELELAALCALNSLYVGKTQCASLQRIYGTLPETWKELSKNGGQSEPENKLASKLSPALLEAAVSEVEECERNGILMLPFWDPRYPNLLASIVNPPPLLYVYGSIECMAQYSIAMVGSRQTSMYGRRVATGLTGALVEKGYTIVSGLALGIDSECHMSAIDNGGKTVAVLGSGIKEMYPSQNRGLAKAISKSGAIVSEFPLRAKPARFHFPRRNRVISGLSLATIVVEAGIKSGALITATWAAEQGREVFAVPGPVDTGLSAGCHQLLKEGARLVETVEDIEAELASLKALFVVAGRDGGQFRREAAAKVHSYAAIDPDEARKKLILDTIGIRGMNLDGIEEQTGLGPELLLPLLLDMELGGQVIRKAGSLFLKNSDC